MRSRVQPHPVDGDDVRSARRGGVRRPLQPWSDFNSTLSLNGPQNALDMILFRILSDDATPEIHTEYFRFDASRFSGPMLAPVVDPLQLDGAPIVAANIPAKDGTGITVGGPPIRWIGEYLGLSSVGNTAVVSWPQQALTSGADPVPDSSRTDTDLSLGTISFCQPAPAKPDFETVSPVVPVTSGSVWECSNCDCGSAGTEPLVGCVSATVSDFGSVCSEVCAGSVCGISLACSDASAVCTAPTAAAPIAHPLIGQACDITAQPEVGSSPSDYADFTSTASAASSAVVTVVGGPPVSTAVQGTTAINVSASPPVAGTGIELARIHATIADFSVTVGQFQIAGIDVSNVNVAVSQIVATQLQRFQGTFTDATHFVIPAGEANTIIHFVGLPDPPGPDLLFPPQASAPFDRTVLVVNTSPATGTFDLAAGTFSLDSLSADGNGDEVALHIEGPVAARQPSFARCRNVVVSAGPSCTAEVTPSMVDNGSSTGNGTAPILALSPPGPFALGTTPVTLKVSDGVSEGTCVAQVTVNDPSPLSLSLPANVTTSSCATTTQVTVGQATSSAQCAVSAPSGSVVASNGVPRATPIPVVGGTVTLGPGTHTILWTVSDGVNTRTGNQTVTVLPTIQASSSLLVDDRAVVRLPNGAGAAVLNSGTAPTQIGDDAHVGGIVSAGPVSILDRAAVSGDVTSAGSITLSSSATVSGARNPSTPVSLPDLPALPSFPPATGGSIIVNSGATRSLVAGSYSSVTVNSGGALLLGKGDYFFQSLTINASVTLRATPTTRVFVQSQLALRSSFLASSGSSIQSVFLGFAGSSLVLEATFNGTLVAPEAAVEFGTGSGLTFAGAFYGWVLEVRPQSTLVCVTSAAF